jgi:hypothetical protein
MRQWRTAITDPQEIKLFEALEHNQFIWRTLPALIRESGLKELEVRGALSKYSTFVLEGSSSGERVWALRERYWEKPGIPQIIHMITHTTTSTST